MRRLLALILTLVMICPTMARAQQTTLLVDTPAETVRPGRAIVISFHAPQAGTAEILIKDAQGQTVSVVAEDFAAVSGQNMLWWNGTWQGVPAPAGEYLLTVILGNEAASAPVTVGGLAPYLAGISVDNAVVSLESGLTVRFMVSAAGYLTTGLVQNGQRWTGEVIPVAAGENTYLWDWKSWPGAGLTDGPASFTLMLTDAEGTVSSEEHIAITLTAFDVPKAEPSAEPAGIAAPEEPDAPAEDATGDEGTTDTDALDAWTEMDDDIIVEDGVLMDGDLIVEDVLDEPAQPDVFTPAYGSPYQDDDTLNYWTLPMDITDEAAVWEVLMQPITVLDNGKKKAERTQVVLRAEPDEDSEGVGVVTCINQGVHVLETLDNGWTLIEAYSSSFHDSAVKRWNQLVQGYVKTSLIKTTKPAAEMGIVIDKLTQRAYVFKEGKLFSTLLVSTGLTNAKQPWNETRSGEFLLTSPVGEFASGNQACSMAIRFNDGDLLHELPHNKLADGGKSYSYDEPKLGTKASHGCIRVQRKRNAEGLNMQWLWNNRKKNTKLLIWEDWQGRQIPIPDDDLTLYYNPNGGTMYHTAANCYSVKNDGVTFETFTYGQLEEEPYASLKWCNYCAPALRQAQIEAINEQYLPGGDHDPIMTEARIKQLEKEGK